MSGKYISREAAIKEVYRFDGYLDDDMEWRLHYALKKLPAADVSPVRHGRWMWDGGEDMHYYCSLCHHNAYGNTGEILDGEYKYCPSCGAKMDGGQDDAQ